MLIKNGVIDYICMTFFILITYAPYLHGISMSDVT